MEEPAAASLCDINFLDLKIYQHPPCMFTLWYVGLVINAWWDDIMALFDGEGGAPPPPEDEGEG